MTGSGPSAQSGARSAGGPRLLARSLACIPTTASLPSNSGQLRGVESCTLSAEDIRFADR